MTNNCVMVGNVEYDLNTMSIGELIILERKAVGEASHPVIRSLICDLSLSSKNVAQSCRSHPKRMRQKKIHKYKGYKNNI